MSTQFWIIVLIVALFVGWLLGVLFYSKFLDKPETINRIGKIKARGRGNTVSFTLPEEKPKFGFLKKILNRRKAKNSSL
jgi:hypothetical protein